MASDQRRARATDVQTCSFRLLLRNSHFSCFFLSGPKLVLVLGLSVTLLSASRSVRKRGGRLKNARPLRYGERLGASRKGRKVRKERQQTFSLPNLCDLGALCVRHLDSGALFGTAAVSASAEFARATSLSFLGLQGSQETATSPPPSATLFLPVGAKACFGAGALK